MYRLLQRNNNGFTLTELLVAVVILGLLTAVGVTAAYRTITVNAERKMVENNLRMIDAAIALYYEEGKGKIEELKGDNLFELLVPDYLTDVISGPGTARYRISDIVMTDREYPQAQVVCDDGDEVGGYPLPPMSHYTIDYLPWYNE
mgnify:FL=1